MCPNSISTTRDRDIEYDDQGRIVEWGIITKPTPHKFTIDRCQRRTASVETRCPTTGTVIRLTVAPEVGVTALDPPRRSYPSSTRAGSTPPRCKSPAAIRSTSSPPQPARDWQSRYPGMTVLPVAEAYSLLRPLADAILGGDRLHHGDTRMPYRPGQPLPDER
ncbi:organomercurial lyase [Mycobacterium xenopi]|uniref:organomercurial lyase n=1 Tax=Mycobacterium xenopi TaxID=1789 RepID=UPI0012F49DFB|nr:organomercurial lyase [Mycobacterium xenopi]